MIVLIAAITLKAGFKSCLFWVVWKVRMVICGLALVKIWLDDDHWCTGLLQMVAKHFQC